MNVLFLFCLKYVGRNVMLNKLLFFVSVTRVGNT